MHRSSRCPHPAKHLRRPGLAALGPAWVWPCLAMLACAGASGPSAADPAALPAASAGLRSQPTAELPPPTVPIRFTFLNTTLGPRRSLPAYVTCTGRDGAGRLCHLDRSGRFLPCSPADNVVVRNGRTWCDYAIPLRDPDAVSIDPALTLASARVYISVGAPLYLRVDETSLGLVQPDPANPTDPNRSVLYDWIELTLDAAGFHGNTTCVDQFGLPLALSVSDRTRPGPVGTVGITEARSALFQAYRASVPAAFRALADPGGLRILAPGHGAFAATGTDRDYLQASIDQMWARYRRTPLVLTPEEGTFTGRVDARDRMVFTRAGTPGTWMIRAKPTSAEVFLCDGVLAQGNGTEKMLGAQIAALVNRHLQETPDQWRNAAAYYRREPCNSYARFWHEHGLGGRAYGFAYDDVNDQSASVATPSPLEIRIAFRAD